jgi:hypothetical protein
LAAYPVSLSPETQELNLVTSRKREGRLSLAPGQVVAGAALTMRLGSAAE